MATAEASAAALSPLTNPTRLFGYAMLALLAAFLINSVFSFGFDWPGAGTALAGEPRGLLQAAIYAVLIGVAVWLTGRAGGVSLRRDSAAIHSFNLYLVRSCFWAVLLVGLADAAISFLRVEGTLQAYVGAEIATELSRSQWRGPYVHMPLVALGFVVALAAPRALAFHWLALLVVLAELLIVFARFVFSYEQAFMADLVRFWYGALFLFASAYTLFDEGHVRVDVLYAGMGPTTRGLVNAIGCIFLGMTFCWTILLVGFSSKSSIIASPLLNFEVTQAGFGMYVKYLMAGFLGVFAVTMLIQFVSYLFESVADWAAEPGGRSHGSTAAH